MPTRLPLSHPTTDEFIPSPASGPIPQGNKSATKYFYRSAKGCLAGQTLRLFSATAMTDCCVMQIDKKYMMEVLHREPALSEMFVAFLLTRNIRYEEDLVDQLFNSSEKRLARILLQSRAFHPCRNELAIGRKRHFRSRDRPYRPDRASGAAGYYSKVFRSFFWSSRCCLPSAWNLQSDQPQDRPARPPASGCENIEHHFSRKNPKAKCCQCEFRGHMSTHPLGWILTTGMR
jgi:hypothetical protein